MDQLQKSFTTPVKADGPGSMATPTFPPLRGVLYSTRIQEEKEVKVPTMSQDQVIRSLIDEFIKDLVTDIDHADQMAFFKCYINDLLSEIIELDQTQLDTLQFNSAYIEELYAKVKGELATNNKVPTKLVQQRTKAGKGGSPSP